MALQIQSNFDLNISNEIFRLKISFNLNFNYFNFYFLFKMLYFLSNFHIYLSFFLLEIISKVKSFLFLVNFLNAIKFLTFFYLNIIIFPLFI